ncbi:MAG: hypothetical protein QM706_18080 [Nitrospira sp.]
MKVYPLGGDPNSTVFVDAYDKPFDATIPYDASFFELAQSLRAGRAVADARQSDDRSRSRRSASKKANPFNPDAKTQMRSSTKQSKKRTNVIAQEL